MMVYTYMFNISSYVFSAGCAHARWFILPIGLFRVGEHVAELFETPFLADLENGELPEKYLCDGIEG